MPLQHHFSLRVPEPNNADTVSFSIGIPVQQGQFWVNQSLVCLRSDNQLVYCTFKPLAWWPDRSIKWLKLQASTTRRNADKAHFYVEALPACASPESREPILTQAASDDTIVLTCSVLTCQINTQRLFDGNFTMQGQEFAVTASRQFQHLFAQGCVKLTDWQVEPLYCHKMGAAPALIHLSLDYTQFPEQATHAPIQYHVDLVFQPKWGLVKVTSSITNTNPAHHANGTWDLGEERSVYIERLSFAFTQKNASASIRLSADSDFQDVEERAELWQRSSAGKQCMSPNHVNHARIIAITEPSTLFTLNDKQQHCIQRPVPSAKLTAKESEFTLSPKKFWQNFPTALCTEPGSIHWDLFRAEVDFPIELQPGEQKTHCATIGISSSSRCSTEVHAVINPQWLSLTQVLPRLSIAFTKDPLQAVINSGIIGSESFFAKREAIDEFGWRHFGDLYADHETAGYEGETLFTSHYNNQYDPLLGFLKQWLISGDPLWWELAEDLAQHVIDIDIYHTDLDKPEYNRGLFWHTDHYLPAETATHRTYSRHHQGNAYQDHAGGGGPGGQHCYTSGLQLYYFLTGSHAAQQAVLGLTDWITTVYEGDHTLVGLLLTYKNRHRADLKSISSGAYPLDRGTANYMMALLDSYEITNDIQYLNRVEYIIRQTIAPDDNIDTDRNLTNVEHCWFYTVFLQAVCRYLDIQQVIGKNWHYRYAVACLLHYAKWMANHEHPYLEKPEILEYPNQTWSAQDLRKVAVLSIAATHAQPEDAQRFRAKAAEIKQYVVNAITQSDEKHYTRILALVMQNYGIDIAEEMTERRPSPSLVDAAVIDTSSHPRDQGWPSYVFHVVKQLSVTREWQQLQKRFPALQRKRS